MDPVILAAIIGAVGVCIASVLTWILTRLTSEEERAPLLGEDRRTALEGAWKGIVHQRQGPIRDAEINDWTLKAKKRHVEGTATLHVKLEEKTGKNEPNKPPTTQDILVAVAIRGTLIHGRYFKLEYRGSFQGKEDFLQFGVAILELSLDAHSLKGYFVGIGPIAGRIIDGPAEFHKPF